MNMLRIFEAHFHEKIKNTEAQTKIHHSYKKKRVEQQVRIHNSGPHLFIALNLEG